MVNSSKLFDILEKLEKHGWQSVDLRNRGLEEFPRQLFRYPDIVRIDLGNE